MTSKRPYLLRAMHEWIGANGMTCHIVVDATKPGTQVPVRSVRDGRIVLNIADRAVGQLTIGDDRVRFFARFGGQRQVIDVPIEAIEAVYALESGQGMALPVDEAALTLEPELTDDANPGTPRGHLHAVVEPAAEPQRATAEPLALPALDGANNGDLTPQDGEADGPEAPPVDDPPKGPPRLRVVK